MVPTGSTDGGAAEEGSSGGASADSRGRTRPGRVSRVRVTSRQKSRLRLIVVQAVVISLFVTLFARLWYLQVLSGESYQAQAAEQSVRELVVQPARGLIVDDMGRPLVANRTSWVVTVDRTLLKKMDDVDQEALLRRVARTVGTSYKQVVARTLLCGEPGSVSGRCWNGSPYQPVPVAEDVPQETAVSILEQSEDFPAVLAESVSLRAYPSPYGINAAHLLGYLSPITEEELDEAEANQDTSVHGASVVGRAGVEKQYDQYLRGAPGYKRVAVDSMGRVLGDSGMVEGRPGDTLVTSIDARVQAVVEQQLESTIKTARQTTDPVTGPHLLSLRRRCRRHHQPFPAHPLHGQGNQRPRLHDQAQGRSAGGPDLQPGPRRGPAPAGKPGPPDRLRPPTRRRHDLGRGGRATGPRVSGRESGSRR